MGEKSNQGMFSFCNHGYLDFLRLVWRLVLLWSRVLWKNHINPRIVEVMRVKPNWCKIKHGIIIILWFCRNWWTLG